MALWRLKRRRNALRFILYQDLSIIEVREAQVLLVIQLGICSFHAIVVAALLFYWGMWFSLTVTRHKIVNCSILFALAPARAAGLVELWLG